MQLFELQPRTQVRHRRIGTGTTGLFDDFDLAFGQRGLGPFRVPDSTRVRILVDPGLQITLQVRCLEVRTQFVAANHLEIMGDPARCHNVRQTGRNRGILGGVGVRVGFRTLGGLTANEHAVVAVLVVDQRQEPEVREFLFPFVGQVHLAGALLLDITCIGFEGQVGQVLDLAAILQTADRGAPAIGREGFVHFQGHLVGGVRPHQLRVVLGALVAFGIGFKFLVVERFRLQAIVTIGQTGQRAWQCQGHVAAVITVAERIPCRIKRAVEASSHRTAFVEPLIAVEVKHLVPCRRNERCVAGCRDFGHVGHGGDVFVPVAKVVVPDERAIRLTARGAEFTLVQRLEQGAAIHGWGILELLQQLFFVEVNEPDFLAGTNFALTDYFL